QFVIVWVDDSATGTSGSDIQAQVFNADGTKAGAEFVINTTVAGPQLWPSVEVLNDGRFVVSWTDGSATSTSDYDVRAQIFDPRQTAVTFEGTAANEQYAGTLFDDTLNGQAGADALFGAAGNDVLNGGDGNDILDGGAGADALQGETGIDTASY